MKHPRRFLTATLAILATAALLWLSLLEVRQVMAACSITWDLQEPTCIVADEDETFEHEVETSFTSYNQIPWTMYLRYTPGNSFNILNGAPSPAVTHTINTAVSGCGSGDGSGCGGVVVQEISGTLSEEEVGSFQLSAWDGTYWNCSDSFDVEIQPFGGNCN